MRVVSGTIGHRRVRIGFGLIFLGLAHSGLGYTRWRTFTVSGATTALGGTISRHRTAPRNTRKVSIRDPRTTGGDPHTTTRQIHAGKREAGQRECLASRRIRPVAGLI